MDEEDGGGGFAVGVYQGAVYAFVASSTLEELFSLDRVDACFNEFTPFSLCRPDCSTSLSSQRRCAFFGTFTSCQAFLQTCRVTVRMFQLKVQELASL